MTSKSLLPAIFIVLVSSAFLPRRSAQAQQGTACFPACRVGFVCSPTGACVSACNPACPEGHVCTSAAACVPTQPTPAVASPADTELPAAPGSELPALAPVPAWGPPGSPAAFAQPPAYPPPGFAPPPMSFDRDPPAGWARGGAIFGFLAAAGTLALTGVVIDNNAEETADEARGFGMAATALIAAATPVVAAAGSSARRLPDVRGAVGLRVTGWIGYGVALANALAMIALSYDTEIGSEQIALGGGLGALATSAFAIDALISASQADAAARALQPPPGFTLAPWVGMARGASLTPTYGLAAGF